MTVWIVSPHGDDRDVGNEISPFRTLPRAGQAALPGDSIYLRGGVYPTFSEQRFELHGAADAPVRIQVWPGDPRPIFDCDGGTFAETQSILFLDSPSYYAEIAGVEVAHSARGRGLSLYSARDGETHDILFRDCVAHDVWGRGLGGSGVRVAFRGCEIYRVSLNNEQERLGGYGVGGWASALSPYLQGDKTLSRDWTVENCRIHHCWGEGVGGWLIDGLTVRDCEIYECYSVGVYLDKVWNAIVSGNHIYSFTDDYGPAAVGGRMRGIALSCEALTPDMAVEVADIDDNLIGGVSIGLRWYNARDNTLASNTYNRVRVRRNTIYRTLAHPIALERVPTDRDQPYGCEARDNRWTRGQDGSLPEWGNGEAWTLSGNQEITRMTWRAFFDATTGQLRSLTDGEEPLPTGCGETSTPTYPYPALMWDAAARGFTTRPAKVVIDRLQDILTAAQYADLQGVWTSLTAAQKTALRNGLIRLLGAHRYRAQAERTEL